MLKQFCITPMATKIAALVQQLLLWFSDMYHSCLFSKEAASYIFIFGKKKELESFSSEILLRQVGDFDWTRIKFFEVYKAYDNMIWSISTKFGKRNEQNSSRSFLFEEFMSKLCMTEDQNNYGSRHCFSGMLCDSLTVTLGYKQTPKRGSFRMK